MQLRYRVMYGDAFVSEVMAESVEQARATTMDALSFVLVAELGTAATVLPEPPKSPVLPEPSAADVVAAELAPPPPARVQIRSRYRDLNSRGRGTECFRMIVDLETNRATWADQHPDAIVTERGWCARGIRASERKCSDHVEVAVGLLVIDIEKSIGPGNGGASYAVGWTIDDRKNPIDWCGEKSGRPVKHCGTRAHDGAFVHVVEIDGVRREFRS